MRTAPPSHPTDLCFYQTLVQDLKGDTHGHFENLLVALATPPALYDCQEVRRAMEVSHLVMYFLCCSSGLNHPSSLENCPLTGSWNR